MRLTHPNAGARNIRVSRETTFLTEPLDINEHVDYLAAMNAEYRAGTNSANNAAVLYWKAGAPERIDTLGYRSAVAAELNMKPYEEREHSYQGLYAFVNERPNLKPVWPGVSHGLGDTPLDDAISEIYSQLRPALVAEDWSAVQRLLIANRGILLVDYSREDPTWPAHQFGQRYPWTPDAYPEAAAWLAHIEPALQTLTAATLRPRYFSPLTGDNEPPHLPAAMLPDLNSMVEIARAFSLRAMLRMGQGDVPGAWADVLAIHRLARLAAQHPCMVALLVAYVIEGKAIDLEECIFASRTISREQLNSMLSDFRELEPFPSPATKFDRLERCMFLECVQTAAREGGAGNVLAGDSVYDAFEPTASVFDWWIDQIVDWNNVLAAGNARFDEVVAALEHPSYKMRKAACNELETAIHKLIHDVHTPANFRASFVRGSAMERRVAAAYIAALMPDFRAAIVADERLRMRQELAETGLRVAIHRAGEGEFPDSLAVIIDDASPNIPLDRFDGKPIRYRRTAVGYVLYSIGEDAQDDGGLRPGAWQMRDKLHGRNDIVFEALPMIQPE